MFLIAWRWTNWTASRWLDTHCQWIFRSMWQINTFMSTYAWKVRAWLVEQVASAILATDTISRAINLPTFLKTYDFLVHINLKSGQCKRCSLILQVGKTGYQSWNPRFLTLMETATIYRLKFGLCVQKTIIAQRFSLLKMFANKQISIVNSDCFSLLSHWQFELFRVLKQGEPKPSNQLIRLWFFNQNHII